MTVNGINEKDPLNWVPVLEQAMFTPRKLRLVCIGAGFSGLTLAHKISQELRLEDKLDLQIYEKNPDVGGTWYENRYPGIACDNPAHIYTFQFEPNPNWSSFYASGPEIWKYIKDTAVKYDLLRFVSLKSRVTDTIWDEDTGKWKLKIDKEGATTEDECDILIDGSGVLNKWRWPNIKGLKDFKGKLLHTAKWDTSYDWAGKKIAVIGNGSSAIQVVPQLQPNASVLVNYMRNPTWISANYLGEFTPEGRNFKYTEEEKKKFREDPESHFKLRKALEHVFNNFILAMIEGRPEQEAVQIAFTKIMKDRLNGSEDLIARLIPAFKVGCRRLTPGDGYLEALGQKNVRCQWNRIIKVTERGILTEQGEEEFDFIVCATGFDVSFRPSWNLVARNGYRLDEAFKDYPKAYFGTCAAQVPNFFTYMGPNSPVAHGSLTASMDVVTEYILKWCHKISTEDIKAVCVKQSVIDDLDVYSQELLKRTVWAGTCRSWYKNGKEVGPITALHAGTVIHYREVLQEIRGEHFELTYRSVNAFRFLGNGFTLRDEAGGDLGFYLKM